MAARFHGRTRRGDTRNQDSDLQGGFGEWWAAIAVIALATTAIFSLSGSTDGSLRLSATNASTPAPADPTPLLLASIGPAEKSLTEVKEAFATLCRAPVLLALELEPDCETGVISLPDHFFNGFGSATLAPEYQEEVAAAMRVYMDRLRAMPAIWDSLESIELRGHSDPRAVRTPYTTNLIGSQQRPIGVLLFLMSPNGLSKEDREDLQKLAVVSGASFSRPPSSCPESTRECYPKWRRVEIRPVLSESLRRQDWSRTLEGVRDTARQIQQELQPSTPTAPPNAPLNAPPTASPSTPTTRSEA